MASVCEELVYVYGTLNTYDLSYIAIGFLGSAILCCYLSLRCFFGRFMRIGYVWLSERLVIFICGL